MGIAARQHHVLGDGLSDEQAIKGIAVMMRELANARNVCGADGQQMQSAIRHGLREKLLIRPWQAELVEAGLDCDLPQAGDAHMSLVLPRGECFKKPGGQHVRLTQEPKQGVRVEQQPHFIYSSKSPSGASKSGAIQKVPGRFFHRPGLAARLAGAAAGSISALIRMGRRRHASGRGRWSVPSADGSNMAVKTLMGRF